MKHTLSAHINNILTRSIRLSLFFSNSFPSCFFSLSHFTPSPPSLALSFHSFLQNELELIHSSIPAAIQTRSPVRFAFDKIETALMVAIIGAVGIPKIRCGKKHCMRLNVNYSILNRFNLVRMEEFCTRSFGSPLP